MSKQKVLELVEQGKPHKWWQRYRHPNATQIAQASLEICRRELLDHAADAEYHAAIVRMLKDREKRLIAEVTRLNGEA